jgi:hypothetical protein
VRARVMTVKKGEEQEQGREKREGQGQGRE